jgi:hypothetical protein
MNKGSLFLASLILVSIISSIDVANVAAPTKMQTTMSATVSPNPANVEENITLLGSLLNADGTPLRNAIVRVYANGTYCGYLRTNYRGDFGGRGMPRQCGNCIIIVSFGGDEVYDSCASQVDLYVLFPYVLLKANFHAHTTASDGEFTPTEVVQLYHDAGYDCIAITDHNTLDGVQEAREAGERLGVIVIRGEEVSCQWSNNNLKHIVALWINKPIYPLFRFTDEVKRYFDAIHGQGGIGIVAHPWYPEYMHGLLDPMYWNWYPYRNSTFIDGWEALPVTADYLVRNGYISVCSHDFHRYDVPTGYYNLILSHNRTEAGVREALVNRRNLICFYGGICGTAEAVQLYEIWKGTRARDQSIDRSSLTSINTGVTLLLLITDLEHEQTTTLITDLNEDGRVNLVDLIIVAIAYGSKPGDSRWNAIADLDKNGETDMMDVCQVAAYYKRT